MASISFLLVSSALAAAAHASDTSVAAHAPYLQEDTRFCSDGSLCYNSLLQHGVASLRTSVKSAAVSRLEGQPAVYVYELPANVTDNGTEIVLREMNCPWAVSEDGDDCIFGAIVDLSLPGLATDSLRARDIDNYALGRVFFASLLKHPRRTHNPREADLFFIPVFTGPNPEECPTAEQLVQRLPHLNSETAGRHFWLTPTTGWGPRTCEVFNSQLSSASPATQLLAKTTKMALEDRTSAPLSLVIDDHLGTKHEEGRGPPVAENLHSVPYPSVISGLDDANVQAWLAYATDHRRREHLVSAVWDFHGLASTMDTRMKLTRQCQWSPKCFFKYLQRVTYNKHFEDVQPVKLNSTFCLEPTGDTISRKGIVDSIVTGCIPVLFSPLQELLWPWHVDLWEDVAILVEDTSQDVIGLLAQVPESEVKRLQGNIAKLAPRLTFSPPGQIRSGDALETTLAAIWKASA